MGSHASRCPGPHYRRGARRSRSAICPCREKLIDSPRIRAASSGVWDPKEYPPPPKARPIAGPGIGTSPLATVRGRPSGTDGQSCGRGMEPDRQGQALAIAPDHDQRRHGEHGVHLVIGMEGVEGIMQRPALGQHLGLDLDARSTVDVALEYPKE